MSNPRHEQPQLFELLARLRENELTADEVARLQSLLHESESARSLYVQYMNLVAGLHWDRATDQRLAANLAGPLAARPKPAPVSGFLPQIGIYLRSASFGSTLLVAICVYGVFGLMVWQMSRFKHRPAAELTELNAANATSEERGEQQGESEVAAALASAEGCQWQLGGETVKLRDGTKLRVNDTLHLLSGTAEIAFADGAKVLLEGPSKFIVQRTDCGQLDRGKLLARVPQQAIGFTIATPRGRIVDLGTEFVVNVDTRGETKAQVFQGSIEIESSGETAPGVAAMPVKRRVVAGEAVSIGPSGQIAAIAPRMTRPVMLTQADLADEPPSLVDAKPLTNVAGPPQSHLALWLRADTGVVEQQVAPGEDRVVRWQNQVQPHDAATDLVQGNHAQISGPPAVPRFDILSNTPIETLASVRGKEYPVVRFNGVSYLQNQEFGGGDSFTIYLVAKSNGAPDRLVEGSFTAYHTLAMLGAIDFSTPGTAWGQILEWRKGVGDFSGVSLGANFPGKALDIASPSSPRLESQAWQIVELRKVGDAPGLTQFYYNGHYVAQVSGTQPIGKGLFLGGFAFGGLNGDIAEVLIYDAPLYETDRQLVEGLLAWKYDLQTDLPRGHLYFNVNPSLPPAK